MTRNAIYKAATASALMASLLLAACGGGSGSATDNAGNSSSAATSSSSSSSQTSSSSSSVTAAVTLLPSNGETAAYTDTRLSITFDSTPTLGSSGFIRVYKASDDTLVDTISLNVFATGSTVASAYTATSLTANDTQTAIPKLNTEIDKLGHGAGSALTQWRWSFYKPVSIAGNTATIRLHDGVLDASTAYYVQIDSGVLAGKMGGASFNGIADKTTWAFTTKALPATTSSVTVDDDGAADFRTVQGAINWVIKHCGTAGSDSTCTGSSVAKTITIKNGTYDGELFIRNINNLTLTGESRDGVLVRSVNSEQYNPGTGGSKASPTTTSLAVAGGNRPRLDGGRALLLVEGADLLTLNQFTLQNAHVKTSGYNNQAETIYYNSASLSGSRWMGTYMNFISTQDTIQTKGWMWIYKSLVAGDVDFIWGAVYGGLLEESELRTVVDTTNPSSGGYITEARTVKGFPGFVILNSSLTRESGVPDGSTYLARQASNFQANGYCTTDYTSGSLANANYGCNNIAYIKTKMGAHIKPAGWYAAYALPLTVSATTGYRESGSMDLSGTQLTLSGRDASISSSSQDLSGLDTRTKVFAQWNGNVGWTPSATTCISSVCATSLGQ